ncbi:hypothetical protein BDR04DRAFT_1112866 [Suillus decipiens]|nr:hypothetical protein BDR04DRAFT_1112866 [Suillus decipiens]
MAPEAKCIPDDKPNLVVEKEEWCHRWSNLTKCIKARQEKGVTLALTSEDVVMGHQVAEWHNTFIGQLHTLKEEAARQAEIQTQQSAGPDIAMGNQGDDEDGEDEFDPPEVHPKRIHKSRAPVVQDVDDDLDDGIVIHDMRCQHWRVKGALSAGLLSSTVPILIKGKDVCVYHSPHLQDTHESEILDLLTDWEEAPSASWIPKAKPMVMMPSRKCKLVEVEEEDFDLADSGLHGDDLMVASRLRGTYGQGHQ